MAIGPGIYNTGTATVASGGLTVSFQGVPNLQSKIRLGDRFGGHVGFGVRIAAVGASTVTLAHPWPGAAQTAAPYEIVFTPYDLLWRQALDTFIERYGSSAVAALADLALTANTLPYGNGSGTMALTPLSEFARTLLDDVNSAAARSTLSAVAYVAQSLNNAQKGQALLNLGAGSMGWNWVINGDFAINQRGGIKKPADGVYGYDRWKGHANGIEQIIESLPPGVYTLSWDGGGTGTFGGVTSSSPVVAGWGSVAHRSVIVPATATNVSLIAADLSAQASNPFVARSPQLELALCQRYYETGRALMSSWSGSTQSQFTYTAFKQTKRVVPTIALANAGDESNVASVSTQPNVGGFQFTVAPASSGALLRRSNSWSADAEL